MAPPANAGDIRDTGSIPGSGRSLEKEMAAHSSILAWRLPRTEEPGGLQSLRSQRVRSDLARTLLSLNDPEQTVLVERSLGDK